MGILAAVAVVGIIVGFVLSSNGGGHAESAQRTPLPTASHHQSSATPSTTPDAAAHKQAKALDDLLADASGDRKKADDAVRAVDRCDSAGAVSDAGKQLTEAAKHRDSLVTRLNKLEFDQVDGGAEAASYLRSAWQDSADADRAFAAWAANAASGGCTKDGARHDADYDRGTESSDEADQAKQDFADKWEPIAKEQGLEARPADAL